jgi:2,4-dienoyl-CoA reductase-like NADH-dependent reductase (Old Yellow Enzyme family)
LSDLFDPLVLGDLVLPNRVVLAPLTRTRAGTGRVPVALNAEYYAQRASAGLILTEATSVEAMGVGYPNTPGIWSTEQVQGWRAVTRAVHAAGGRIFLQLWHVGRVSDPEHLDGQLPVAPSAIAPGGHVSLLRPERPFVTPRALAVEEIPVVVGAYRQAGVHARDAGFDGVEIHAANGYLIDQFLQDGSNRRGDAYGGSIENRSRLLLEVTDAVVQVWGPGRVGVHLAPRGDAHSMGDSDPAALFLHVARELGKRRIAFLCTRESEVKARLSVAMKQAFGGVLIANEGFTPETAAAIVARGEADAVAFGKAFIANPDLPARIARQAPLNAPDPSSFYVIGDTDPARGYTDYPALGASAAAPEVQDRAA